MSVPIDFKLLEEFGEVSEESEWLVDHTDGMVDILGRGSCRYWLWATALMPVAISIAGHMREKRRMIDW